MYNPRYKILVGIDTGVNTGFAVWNKDTKNLEEIITLPIHKAMFKVKEMHQSGKDVFVRVEDARKRKWFGSNSNVKLQGAGSVKRDCSIWEDFLTDLNIPFELVAPKNNKTKLSKQQFKQATGYQGVTSEHSRDAAMLVYNF